MPAPDLDAFLDGYELPVEEVPICGRAGLVADHAQAEAAVLAARADGGLGGVPPELVERLEELEREIEESVLVFRVRGVSQRAWADLLAAHPPTKDQREKGSVYNQDTFEPAALSLCAIEPTVSIEQALRIRETLPAVEWARLILAVINLNQKATQPPKSPLLSALHLMSELSSTTPQSEGSLDHGSLGSSGEQSPSTSTTTRVV